MGKPNRTSEGAGRTRRRRPDGHSLFRLSAFLSLVFLVCAFGEQKFPPPEFETGYRLPPTLVPSARAVAMQYLDILVLLATLGFASYLTLRKRSRAWIAGLSFFSLLYFGFYRGGCVCAIGSIQNVALAGFNRTYALPVAVGIFFLAPIVFALLFGRSFCAAACPHGALQDLVLVKPVKMPAWLEHGLSILPYLYLGGGVVFAATGSAFVICRADPFIPIFRMTGPTTMVLLGLGFVVLAMFLGRPYCRFMCPYGAVLKLASLASRWRVTVTPSHCSKCRICDEMCPYGAIRVPVAEPKTALKETVPPPPAAPATLPAPARKHWVGWAILVPVLVAAGALLGSRLSVPLSRLDANVALAERFLDPAKPAAQPNPPTPDSLALGRAEQNAREILGLATATRARYRLAGWLFGGWIGLVVGAKLLAVSIKPEPVEYEPDRGACLGCGRCFRHCPHEKVRRASGAPKGGRLPAPPPPLRAPPQAA